MTLLPNVSQNKEQVMSIVNFELDKALKIEKEINSLLQSHDLSKNEKKELEDLLLNTKPIIFDLNKRIKEEDSKNWGDYTLQEIADRFGISRERARQIESSAINKLRHPKIGLTLKNYIDK